MDRWIRIEVLVAVALAVCGVCGEEAGSGVSVPLAANGQALHDIVVLPTASESVKSAAGDLARYLTRISGAEFSVVERSGSPGIVLGRFSAFPTVVADFDVDEADPLRRNEYLVRTHPEGVWLLGASDGAVAYAVWDVLHRFGYRLFFLTDTWEVVPDIMDLHLAAEAFERPDYISRRAPRGAPWSDSDLWTRWRTRNRITPNFRLNTAHAYGTIIRQNREAFAAHPEYYALVGGERRVDGGESIKFCISNPGLRELVVNWAVRVMRDNPEQDSISLDPSDGSNWCECESCAEMGSVSDRVVILANEVAEAINALGLGDKYVGIYAYNEHSPPPDIPVHPRVVASIATAFIGGGFTVDELIDGWDARGAVLGIREYHDVFPWSHDLPRRAQGGRLGYLQQSIPHFHARGARFMNAESSDSWGANGLGYWISPILLWDVSAAERIDELVEDFLEKAFGPGRNAMREFYDLLNRDRSPRTPEDITARMYRALSAARDVVDDPRILARLDDLVLYTRYVELYNRYRAASGAERQDGFEAIWRHAYRMRDRMMLSTVAICNRDRFRDQSVHLPDEAKTTNVISIPKLEELPESEPWKDSSPFSSEEIAGILADGLAANQPVVLDFTPVEFGEDLIPAVDAIGTVPTGYSESLSAPGSFNLTSRRSRKYFIWLDEPGAFTLRVTGGLIKRKRGNVRISLSSPLETTLEPVAIDESVPPDGETYSVTLQSPYGGLHTLEISDGGDMTRIEFPDGMPLTILSSPENPPGRTLHGRWSLYFYVPKGTTVVGGFTRDLSGRMLDGSGREVLDFASLEHPGYFSVPVADEQSRALWKIEKSREKLLMTVPPYLATSGATLLLPRDVERR